MTWGQQWGEGHYFRESTGLHGGGTLEPSVFQMILSQATVEQAFAHLTQRLILSRSASQVRVASALLAALSIFCTVQVCLTLHLGTINEQHLGNSGSGVIRILI